MPSFQALSKIMLFTTVLFPVINAVSNNKQLSEASKSYQSDEQSLANPMSQILLENTRLIDPFSVTFEQQEDMFTRYVERISEVKNGKKGVFFPSGVDVEMLKSYEHDGSSHKIVVIDVGGTVFKATIMNIIMDEETKRPKCSDEMKITVPFEEWNDKHKKPLINYKWHEWVAEILSTEMGYESRDIQHAALTFSYSLTKHAIDVAVIEAVFKNWPFAKYKELTEENVIAVLNESLGKKNLSFRVNSVLNDSVSTCVHGIAQDGPFESNIALILGTGVNMSFMMPINGKVELLNNEMARFPIHDDLLTAADVDVITDLENNGSPYQKLEVLIAGYKFIEIVKKQLARQGYATADIEDKISLKYVIEVLNDSSIAAHGDAFEYAVRSIAYSYKRRAGKLLSAILLAASLSVDTSVDNTVRLIMNGSICQHSLDREIIHEELTILARRMGVPFKFEVINAPNASLDGSALAAVAYRTRQD